MSKAYQKKAAELLQQLDQRTRNLFLLLLAVIVFSAAFNLFFKPQRRAIMTLQQEASAVNNRILEIKARIPDVDREQSLLVKERTDAALLQEELKALESQLPKQDSLPGLLNELFRQPEGHTIDFTLLKPGEEKQDRLDYDRLNIEMRFTATYASLFNYLYRLERFSQFITPVKVEIEEPKGTSSADLNVQMTLSTLLGDSVKGIVLSKVVSPALPAVEPQRNSFQSTAREALLSGDQTKYTLSGIVSIGKHPTAIINDEVFKIGDWVGSSQVEEILAHSVILREGQQRIVVTVDSK